MDRDELRDQLLRAAEADPAAVDRVARAALASGEESAGALDRSAPDSPARAWPRVLAALAACVVVAVALGVWWSTRQPAAPVDGVYRVEALPASAPEAVGVVSSPPRAAPDGVYRTSASLTVAPSRVFRVRTGDGTIWILSMDAADDWSPPGSRVVIGGGETR